MHRIFALGMSLILLFTVSTAAFGQGNGLTAEQAKTKIARAGTGEKAKVTVWTRDGKKYKSYVTRTSENDFTVRDRKTDAETIIAYTDVNKIDLNRGHSTARNIGIGVGAGVGGLLVILGIAIASLD